MIKKILFFILLFSSTLSHVFALDAHLEIDKPKTDINEYINLKLGIEITEWWNISVEKIEWLNEFEIVSQSQWQSSSSSTVIVDWKTQNQTKTIITLDLLLRAKEKWKYTIWPATIQTENWQIETNMVDIEVTWDKIFINNNLNYIKNNSKTAKKEDSNISSNEDNEINTYDNVTRKQFEYKNWLYLMLWTLLIFTLIFYLLIKNNEKFSEKITNNNFVKKYKLKSQQKEGSQKTNKEDQEIIIYPDIRDKDFINKVDIVLKKKIQKLYNIENIEHRTLEEIDNLIKDDTKIKNLIKLVNKMKYSNYILDSENILELLKQI